MSQRNALIVVDVQNDFMPWGALPVAEGDQVVAVVNLVMPHFDFVVASLDWHPKNHGSFASQYPNRKPGDHTKLAGVDQILWPDHCVQETDGAKFVSSLEVNQIDKIIHKGTNPQIDSYSTFFDNAHLKETGMSAYLKENQVTDVYLLGLATDYCVKYSVLDAIRLGYETHVIVDGCRGVELKAGDSQRAFEEMENAGAELIHSNNLVARYP